MKTSTPMISANAPKTIISIVGLCALILLLTVPMGSQTGTIMPSPFQTALDNSGKIINNACVWTYIAGTTTPVSTYTTQVLNVANLNPIRSDSAGRFTAYLIPGNAYKFVYESACTPPAHGSTLRTADNIAATPTSAANVDTTGTAGETLTAGLAVYLSDGSGGKNAGQWYKTDTGNAYSNTLPEIGMAPSAIASGASGTIRLLGQVTGLSLSPGVDYYIGAAGAVATTGTRRVGRADSATSLVLLDSRDPGNVDVTGTAGETITAGQAVYLSDGSGGKNAGQWYKADATNLYSSITPVVGVAPMAITSGTVGLIRVGGSVTGLSALNTGAGYYLAMTPGAFTSALPGNARRLGQADTGTSLILGGSAPSTVSGCDVRLTLTSGTAVTTGDVTGATSVFVTPYVKDQGGPAYCSFYDTTSLVWTPVPIAEVTVALGTLTSGLPYDIFCTNTAGAMACDAPLAWSSTTARATALATQNGVLVKTGALSRRWMGTFFTTSTTQTEDSLTKRYLFNAYHRVRRPLQVITATASWSASGTGWRLANSSTANQVGVMIGLSETPVHLSSNLSGIDTGGSVAFGSAVGIDSTTTPAANQQILASANFSTGANSAFPSSVYDGYPGLGQHLLIWLERTAGGATTFNAGAATYEKCGLSGWIEG